MSKLKDITGQTFGYLTVIERANNTSAGLAQWKCVCKCGKETIVRGSCLRNGHTQSCGCKQKEAVRLTGLKGHQPWNFQDLTGQKFGKLTVISRAENTIGDKAKWKCLCECGNIAYVTTNDLKKQHSCGCILSYKEETINQILLLNSIKYETQVKFKDLVSDKGVELRFDFGIIKNNTLVGLIEYQGEQHTLEKPKGFYTQERIDRLQYHDRLKKEYCKNNKIPLLLLDKNSDLEKEILSWIERL